MMVNAFDGWKPCYQDFCEDGSGGAMSPRATSAEEPYGGNLLVRLWRGAGLG